MSIHCAHMRALRRLAAVFTGVLILCCAVAEQGRTRDIYWGRKDQKVVVIDPGHGGNDTGAVGPQGTYEKAVVLQMAQVLRGQLEKRYRVVLTRDGDYSLDLFRRTGVANHHKADLFMSLHTGAGYLAKASGIVVFYLQEGPLPLDPADHLGEPLHWEALQQRHIPSAKRWARLLLDRFAGQVRFTRSTLGEAPLAIIKGADMPALLIEIGHLTHPGEEKALRDPQTLEAIGRAIGDSIDDYFESIEQSD